MKNSYLHILYPLVIVIGIVALYHQVTSFGFSGLDDILMIEENWDRLPHLSHIKTAFTEDVFIGAQGSYYRPVQILSYMPDAILSGSTSPTPKIFFEINLILFVGAFLLLYFFLKELRFSLHFRFIFTLLMATHPTLTPAVAWVPGRVDTLLFILVIGSIWSFLRYLKNQNSAWIVLHTLLFALGMFTKETTIVVPVICILWVVLWNKQKDPTTDSDWSWKRTFDLSYWMPVFTDAWHWIKNHLGIMTGWVLSLVVWYIMRKNALPDNPLGMMSTLYQLSSSWKEFIILGGVTFFPYHLQVFLEVTWPFVFWAIPGFLLFLGLPVLLKKNHRTILFGLLWMFLFILPTTLSDYLNYHRMFIPLVGMAFILKSLDQPIHFTKNKLWVPALFLALFIWQSIDFQKAFTNRVTFWNNAVTYSPSSAFANNGLAWSYHLDHENDSALKYYEKVVELRPDRENVRMGMALIYEENKQYRLADSLMEKEFIATKDSSQVYFYWGQIELERGDTAKAIENLILGLPAQNSSRNARLYYDTLAISLKNQLPEFTLD